MGSHLLRYRGCSNLASLPTQRRQCHRQPLGRVSPPVSRSWQAPGAHPSLTATGTQEWWGWGGREGRQGSLHTDIYTMPTNENPDSKSIGRSLAALGKKVVFAVTQAQIRKVSEDTQNHLHCSSAESDSSFQPSSRMHMVCIWSLGGQLVGGWSNIHWSQGHS